MKDSCFIDWLGDRDVLICYTDMYSQKFLYGIVVAQMYLDKHISKERLKGIFTYLRSIERLPESRENKPPFLDNCKPVHGDWYYDESKLSVLMITFERLNLKITLKSIMIAQSLFFTKYKKWQHIDFFKTFVGEYLEYLKKVSRRRYVYNVYNTLVKLKKELSDIFFELRDNIFDKSIIKIVTPMCDYSIKPYRQYSDAVEETFCCEDCDGYLYDNIDREIEKDCLTTIDNFQKQFAFLVEIGALNTLYDAAIKTLNI